ncbi:hypothetical protein AURDEDRAFT_188943 [Auricularia subglabra TFB-10046 SS5]|uniref:Lysine-specific metallo-endopeptidase domain-containing protein n=1 Tax=Auricularia subglabra (strain TFB-10046 / SS5) TaxID=717982 RepID=J0D723_AURST|nr:hypothetical protein AURDEDRAFT_188943 [Auricularia subglabra TFB-10046 SS5]
MLLVRLAALVLSIHAASADLGKAVLFANGLKEPLRKLDDITRVATTKTGPKNLDTNSICKTLARQAGCTDDQVTGKEVWYADCDKPWALCRCSDANMSFDTMERRWAKVPVGLRSYGGTLLAVKRDSGCVAYTFGGEYIRFHGDCGSSVFIHEVSHTVDKGFSSTAAFKDGVAKSSCVPDSYANTNYVEDFAQLNVCLTWALRFGVLSDAAGKDAACMAPQYNLLKSDARIKAAQSATQCIPCVRNNCKTRGIDDDEEINTHNITMTQTSMCEFPAAGEDD